MIALPYRDLILKYQP